MTEPTECSALQSAWEDVAAGLRAGLAIAIKRMPQLNPAEIEQLCNAANTAYWLSVRAAAFDEKVNMARIDSD